MQDLELQKILVSNAIGQEQKLKHLILKGNGLTVLGLDWLKELILHWKDIYKGHSPF